MKKDEFYYLIINMTTAMNKLGINISELADLLDVSSDTISRWLRGVQRPSADNMQKVHSFIHMVLDLNLDYEDLQSLNEVLDIAEDLSAYLEQDDYNDPSKNKLIFQFLDVMRIIAFSLLYTT